jgi:hypothetical protein
MAQHDYNVANATGANFRADLNNALAAAVTQNSGSVEPTPAFSGMLWLDLSGGGDGIMRRRNQANTAWLTDIGVDNTARAAAATAQAKADRALLRDASATAAERTMALSLLLPATAPTGNEAVSRANADALYQVRLPTAQAGALLVGQAGGWTTSTPPGATDTVLAISGGLPTWQPTASVATPNSVVRAKADGTIDATFIPGVASGLKFCGTFKPVVNNEYPTTGGHGAAGAPAIGDFWVVDALTTGGYTYLTGSLAGVTVYNGDSIAYNGAGSWYRMGNTISVAGYVKTDGTVAMAADLNLGSYRITNAGGVIARAGTLVPLQGFLIDTTNVVISPNRGQTGPDLSPMPAAQLGSDYGRMQLYLGAGVSNIAMLPVRFHSTTAAYVAGDYVAQGGKIYRAPAPVSAGAFVSTQWRDVIDSGGGWIIGDMIFGRSTSTRVRFVDSVGTTVIDSVTADGSANAPLRLNATVLLLTAPNTGIQGGLAVGVPGSSYIRFSDVSAITWIDSIATNGSDLAPLYLRGSSVQITGTPVTIVGNFNTTGTIVGNAGGDGSQAAFVIGNDAALWDVNKPHTAQLRSLNNANFGRLEFGQTATSFIGVSRIAGNVTEIGAGLGGYQFSVGGAHYLYYDSAHVAHYKADSAGYGYYWRRNASGGPGGANEVQLMVLGNTGDLVVTGTVTASNFPASDRALKADIVPVAPRDFSALPFYSLHLPSHRATTNRAVADGGRRGIEVAPEYVFPYSYEEAGDLTECGTLNYGGLAIEMCHERVAIASP